MTNIKSLSRSLLLLVVAALAGPMFVPRVSASSNPNANAISAGSSQQSATDVTGTWSGTFQSDHANVAPFTITVVINPDSHGHLVGNSSLDSDCVKDVNLQVTVNGSKIVLAGSDADGNTPSEARLTKPARSSTYATLLTAAPAGNAKRIKAREPWESGNRPRLTRRARPERLPRAIAAAKD